MIKFNNENIKYFSLFLIILLGFWLIYPFFELDKIWVRSDTTAYSAYYNFQKQSIFEYHQYPLWTPYHYGGVPFVTAIGQIYAIPTLINLITPTIEATFHLTAIIEMLLAGIFMFLLCDYLKIKPKFALISSLIIVFNGIAIHDTTNLGTDRSHAYIWVPLVLYFLFRSFKEKETIKNSIFLGIVLAIQFHAGKQSMFLYTLLILPLYAVYSFVISKNKLKHIKKLIVMGAVTGTVLFGLSAIMLIPMLDIDKTTMFSEGRSFEDARGIYIEISSLKDFFIMPLKVIAHKENSSHNPIIGIVGLILVLGSLTRYKNKYVIFSILSFILLFVIASNSDAFHILWKFVPGFNKLHHANRALIIAPSFLAIMAGIGSEILFKKMKSIISSKITLNVIYAAVIILFLFNVGYFTVLKEKDPQLKYNINKDMLEKNKLQINLSNEKGIFRIHNLETDFVGWPATFYAYPFKLHIIDGNFHVWPKEYSNEYLYGYSRYSPLKFYGMLNVKYLYSRDKENTTGLRLIGEFEICEMCRKVYGERGEDGPYLYYNEYYLPRAYYIDNSILIIGEFEEAKRTMYALMIREDFNPSTIAIILGKQSINDYDLDFLKRFNAIFLTKGSIDQNSGFIMNKYVQYGGTLLPDLINNKNSISEEEIANVFNKYQKSYNEVIGQKIKDYTPNKYTVETKNKGFLIISEKFWLYEGWKAKDKKDKKLGILRANGVNSAIYIEDEGNEIRFSYEPKSFKIGATISLITTLMIALYFTIQRIKKRKNKKKHIQIKENEV